MEHRTDLEQLLLDGLSADERQQTVDTINNAAAAEFGRLRTGSASSTDHDREGPGKAAQIVDGHD